MTAYLPYESGPWLDGKGVRRRYRFPNGYGASVISSAMSYGGSEGLWELGVTGPGGDLVYDTPITEDVIGWLTEDEVQATLARIDALPPPA